MLDSTKDEIPISSIGNMDALDGKIKSLNDFIAWLPPGFTGDINNLPLDEKVKDLLLGGDDDFASVIDPDHYLRIPTCWDDYFPSTNNLETGIGDPCRAAQNELDNHYGDYRMPWGTGDGNHEALTSYGGESGLTPQLGADNLYFMQNKYYSEVNRQYMPAYALIYTLEEIHTDENGEDLEQSYYMVSYRADYPGRTPRRRLYSYWTSVKGNQNDLNENAYILHGKGGSDFGEYPSIADPLYVSRNVAMPVRCVR